MPDAIPTRISPFHDQRPIEGQLPLIDEVVAKPATIQLTRLNKQCITALIRTWDQVLTFDFDADAPVRMWHDGSEKPNVGEYRAAPHPDQPRAMYRYQARDVYVHVESLERWLYWVGVFKDGQETHLRIGTADGRTHIRLTHTSQARAAFRYEP